MDVSKISIPGFDELNIKDSYSRTEIGKLLEKTKTIEGNLTLKENNYLSKTITILGDSYSEGYSPDGMTKSYSTIFKETYNNFFKEINIIHKGGSGFNGSTTWQNLVTQNSEIIRRTDILIVLGGYNDQVATNLSNLINNFVTYVKSLNNNIIIYLGEIGISYLDDNKINEVIINYKTIGGIKNCYYLTGIEQSLFSPALMSSDKYHPNQFGQNSIFIALNNCFFTGCYECYNEFLSNINASGSCASISDLDFRNYVTGEICSTYLTFTANFNDFVYNGNGTEIEVATIISNCLNIKNKEFSIARSLIQFNDFTYSTTPVFVYLKNNKIFLSFQNLNNERNNYASCTIKRINIYNAKFSIPMISNI